MTSRCDVRSVALLLLACSALAGRARAQGDSSPAVGATATEPEPRVDAPLAEPAAATEPTPAPRRRRAPAAEAETRPASRSAPHRPAAQPGARARPAAAPSPATQPASAAPDIEALHSLQHDVEALLAAGDGATLAQLCDARRPQEVLGERALYLPWQALCRGLAALARGDSSAARQACAQVAAQAASAPAALRPRTETWILQAQLCLGQAAELDYRSDDTCLARLGDGRRAPAEAQRLAALRQQAAEEYRDVMRRDRGELGLRALLRTVALSDHFYRRVTSSPPNLRGVALGPPGRGLALAGSPLLEASLAPTQSGLRRKVLLSYRKLVQRAREQHAATELQQEIEQALASFEAYQPTVSESVRVPWPARQGESAGLSALARDATGYLLTLQGGRQQRLSTDQAVPRLRALLEPLGQGRWAPLAALELAELADHASAPLLIQALQQDADPELQVSAAYALGRVGNAHSVEPLLQAFAVAQRAAPRTLFVSPEQAAFGLPERILEALIAIGQRDPLAVEGLAGRAELPPREAAYVLWACRAKGLASVYARLREQRDPVVKAYGLMGLVEVQGETVRWALADEPGDSALLRCVRQHLRDELGR